MCPYSISLVLLQLLTSKSVSFLKMSISCQNNSDNIRPCDKTQTLVDCITAKAETPVILVRKLPPSLLMGAQAGTTTREVNMESA